MSDALQWVYLANAVLLILHEIDSAYWREWELFRLPGGIGVFLALHVPLLTAVLVGLVLLTDGERAGLWFAALLSAAGVVAFALHVGFIVRGRPQFRAFASISILTAALVVSIALGGLTALEL